MFAQPLSSRFTRLTHQFRTDTLFQNAVYLMLSTAVQAVFGFGFWLLNARIFTAAQIGLASALISASTFIAYLSLLGFNSTFIRFLPNSDRRNDNLNTGLLLSFITALALAIGYVALIPQLSPKLTFVSTGPLLALSFIVLSAAAAANLLTDSVFIAYRAARFNLIIYGFQSFVKMLLPLALITLGAFGIFAASGLAAVAALGLSLWVMAKYFRYQMRPHIKRHILRQVWTFSSTSYLASLLNIIPTLVLPTIIINQLGAADAGYFYLAFMLANLVYTVAYSISQSFFAEAAYGDSEFRHLLRKAIKLLATIMLPAAAGLALLGPIILKLFGHSYSVDARQTIMVLALAAPAVAANALGGTALRLSKRTGLLLTSDAVYAIATCGLAFLAARHSLPWVAAAWLAGNLITAVISFVALSEELPRRSAQSTATQGKTP